MLNDSLHLHTHPAPIPNKWGEYPHKYPTKIHEYIVTIKHDNGRVRIRTAATCAETAANQVCAAEGAPLSAVWKIHRLSDDVLKEIVCKVFGKYGAPMGRAENPAPKGVMYTNKRRVPMCCGGAYDTGGAYWGIDTPPYVYFTRFGEHWEFVRE